MHAAIGLGSNLDDPRAHVERALQELASLRESRPAAFSGLYRTRPLGPSGQPDYCNAVALLDTLLEPLALLDALQALERHHGRLPPHERNVPRWGPRALDLDILLLDERVIHHPRLEVPHPHLHERAFVLVPLAQVAPDWRVPGQGSVATLAARVGCDGVVPWH